jgi:hypothetical protein
VLVPTATWNPARGVWETPQSAACGHLVPFSETLPRSGMMRNGKLYPPLTQGVATTGSESSSAPGLLLFKTPTAQLGINGGSQHPSKRRGGGHGPTLADEVEHLLPTPNATDYKGSGATQRRDRDGRRRTSGDMDLSEAVSLLPTPTARMQDRTEEEAARRHLPGRSMGRGGGASPDLVSVAVLLPTPAARDYKSGESNLLERNARPLNEVAVAHLRPSGRDLLPTPTASLGTVEATAPWKDGVIWWKQSRAARNVAAIAESMFGQDVVDYGRYARAVLRWAQTINRLPPPPLEMSPRGTLVLSPPFVEWMMGLEPGWVTGLGLSRGAQLKLLGNGVVPQQVVLGLSILLPRVPVLWMP